MKIVLNSFGMATLIGGIAVLTGFVLLNHRPRSEDVPVSYESKVSISSSASLSNKTPANAIYWDQAENGWETKGWTWAKTVDYEDATYTHYGNFAIKAILNPYEGIKFHHKPFPTQPFDRISFWVYGGSQGGQHLQIGVATGEKEKQVINGKIEALPAGKWVCVTVSLTQIRPADRLSITSFWIQSDENKTQLPIWIDEVRLLKLKELAPFRPSLGFTPN